MIPAVRSMSRDEMMKRVAFFKDLKGSRSGLPDSDLPECERELINVIGFQPPKDMGQVVSPVGAEASRLAAIPISEGFNLGFARCKPGRGPLMHNHDTNETFMPITGRWRCAWNEGADYEFIDVGPCDVVSFPPGVARRFMNVTEGEPETEHVIMFVIAGDGPRAEFTTAAQDIMNRGGDGVPSSFERGWTDVLPVEGVAGLRAMQDRYPARTLRLDRLDWRFRDTGGNGPALLLLPGGLGNADIFYKQLLRLPPDIRCIAVDYPEAGCESLASGLILLLDALGLERASLLGSSLAGYWLQIFGARSCERIDSLILANSFYTSTELRQHPLFSVPALSAVDGDKLKEEWLEKLEQREPSELRDVQRILLWEGQSGPLLRSRLLAAATASDAPVIPSGRFPLFILDCNDDPILSPSIRSELAERYRDAARLTLPVGGHYPCVTQAAAYNRFLQYAVLDCR